MRCDVSFFFIIDGGGLDFFFNLIKVSDGRGLVMVVGDYSNKEVENELWDVLVPTRGLKMGAVLPA